VPGGQITVNSGAIMPSRERTCPTFCATGPSQWFDALFGQHRAVLEGALLSLGGAPRVGPCRLAPPQVGAPRPRRPSAIV